MSNSMDCKVCGAPATHTPYCWTCHFWLDLQFPRPGGIIVGGHHYRLGSPVWSDRDHRSLGLGGAIRRIRYLDGSPTITTNNLWYQGEIPERFRADHPDNAEFIHA